MSPKVRVEVLADAAALAAAAADRFRRCASDAVAARGRFLAALAGGRTPRALYERLGRSPYSREIPWPDCVLAIGDERSVPPDHADSNYGMVRRALLSRLPCQPRAVCRFATERADPDGIASDYETDLRNATGVDPGGVPRFDLVLLGLGADAHTASLFPRSPALAEANRLAVAVRSHGSETTLRFTLTPPVLNAAAAVVFLVVGGDKAEAVRDVLQAEFDPSRRPAQIVRPADGKVHWLLDRAAAGLL